MVQDSGLFRRPDASCCLISSPQDDVNARWFAIENLVKGKVYETKAPIEKWDGPWQKH